MATRGASGSEAETRMGGNAAVRIAAAADLHCREGRREEIERAFAELRGKADLVLLAGDLTSVGDPADAAVLAAACSGIEIPVIAVLGNHDWHANRAEEIMATLAEADIRVLDRDHAAVEVAG